ncbi:hypothetical protein FSH82_022035, partial [Escherichia coli]|nr:hypothetical protein [Escherichia coli]
MLVVELIIVLLAIFLGARLGGIGIGFAGGLGVLVLASLFRILCKYLFSEVAVQA